MVNQYHTSVMCREAIHNLCPKEGGRYVDATFGGAGHTYALLDALKACEVYGFDQDPATQPLGEKLMKQDKRFKYINANYRHITDALLEYKCSTVDGIVADLGMSRHQLDTPRGFASHGAVHAPLDMRMDSASPVPKAADLIKNASMKQLTSIFREYGELRAAHAIAKHLCRLRTHAPIDTVETLRKALARFVPPKGERKFFAQVFQALRMAVNDELSALADLLRQSTALLLSQGRLVIISYHSLEDRLVKRFLKYGDPYALEAPSDLKGPLQPVFSTMYKKPLQPSASEIQENNSARSAKMRIGIKN